MDDGFIADLALDFIGTHFPAVCGRFFTQRPAQAAVCSVQAVMRVLLLVTEHVAGGAGVVTEVKGGVLQDCVFHSFSVLHTRDEISR